MEEFSYIERYTEDIYKVSLYSKDLRLLRHFFLIVNKEYTETMLRSYVSDPLASIIRDHLEDMGLLSPILRSLANPFKDFSSAETLAWKLHACLALIMREKE